MHQGKRRLSLILGLAVLAIAVAFPASVAAARFIPPEVAGSHTWTGVTCAGHPVSVTYHVTNRGRVVFDSATGGSARSSWVWHGFRVHFRGTSTRVMVWTTWRHGVLQLHVRSRTRFCPATRGPAQRRPAPHRRPGERQPSRLIPTLASERAPRSHPRRFLFASVHAEFVASGIPALTLRGTGP